MDSQHSGIFYAIAAATLFGASTPFAKELLGNIQPVLLAGLLYAGSGIGLGIWIALRNLRKVARTEAPLTPTDLPWLAGAVLTGGILGPVLLMLGLARMPASAASLLLNLESVLTAAVAWAVVQENMDRRVLLGMMAIVAGGVLLSGDLHSAGASVWGVLGIGGACLCWAIDNNLTRVVSGGDPVEVAAIKGGVAGVVNITLALVLGVEWPSFSIAGAAAVLGFFGYGVSLALFVLGLRHLGTARTGAYFSTAPFVGATLSLIFFQETPSLAWWIAGALMALGVWLHVSEHHDHEHTHEPLGHTHRHMHDEHHHHEHDFPWDATKPHTHFHRHDALTHCHPHYPDLHHRHRHL
jgi:drug/metabolite transporter (DMT)-like permease